MNDEKEKQAQDVQSEEEATEKKVTSEAAEKESDAQNSEKEPAEKHDDKSAEHAAEKEGFKAKIEALEQDVAKAKEALMRTAAEYENHRKRSAKEHDSAFNNGVAYAVEQLLPIVDTLELAAGTPTQDESYKKGVEMTLSKCKEAFEKLGVKEIDVLNKPFDPELASAVLQQPAPEGVESGTVLQVMQKGYMLKDKVIRHAVVAVAE